MSLFGDDVFVLRHDASLFRADGSALGLCESKLRDDVFVLRHDVSLFRDDVSIQKPRVGTQQQNVSVFRDDANSHLGDR